MKIIDKRNLVYFAAQEAWERYSAHLEGLLAGPFCVVSEKVLTSDAKNACEATATTLEYGNRGVTYVTIEPHSNDATSSDAPKPQSAADGDPTAHRLSPAQLFGIIESLDPLVVVAADAQSMALLSHAYHMEFSAGELARLYGRNAVGFVDFPAMLSDPEQKKQAWVHLKRLGHKRKVH